MHLHHHLQMTKRMIVGVKKMNIHQLAEIAVKGMRMNALAKLTEEQIQAICSDFQEELGKKGIRYKEFMEHTLKHKAWVAKARKWMDSLNEEVLHQTAIHDQIKDVEELMERDARIKEIYQSYNLLLKMIDAVAQGHHPLRTANKEIFSCSFCHLPFSKESKIEDCRSAANIDEEKTKAAPQRKAA